MCSWCTCTEEKTADDLVNEFAASLDSLPNKKRNLAL
jgi:hypothetical protein